MMMDDSDELLAMVRRLVAQGRPSVDPKPSDIGGGLFVGSKYHAADLATLASLGVTVVLNCAPTGVRNLPVDDYRSNGIEYAFTNVYQDDPSYPILMDSSGCASEHLQVALACYDRARAAGGRCLFFCVAGQNRSAALAVAAQMLRGTPLANVLKVCSASRPFILENKGFQRQLVALERMSGAQIRSLFDDTPRNRGRRASRDDFATWAADYEAFPAGRFGETETEVQVELLVPGLRTINGHIPVPSSIDTVKAALVRQVDEYLAGQDDPRRVGAAWAIFQPFGGDVQASLLLEEAAVNPQVQAARLHSTFGLDVSRAPSFESATDFNSTNPLIRWTANARFELVIFSTVTVDEPDVHRPYTFRHCERADVPGTLLHNAVDTRLRAWDFVSGEPFRSIRPTVFTYSDELRYFKGDFKDISSPAEGELQSFAEPPEEQLLGMGSNAIVFRIALEPSRSPALSGGNGTGSSAAVAPAPAPGDRPPKLRRLDTKAALDLVPQVSWAATAPSAKRWDAAVKRPFSLGKMLASLEAKSEAGAAKRLRFAGLLNDQGRLLHFYGLGLALAASCNDRSTFHFEAVLLSQFDESFSTYTLGRFMENYSQRMDEEESEAGETSERAAERARVAKLQRHFSIINVKELLSSLIDGLRDLTRAGVQSFDYRGGNVLISRDYRKARLIDIDDYGAGAGGSNKEHPALDVDLGGIPGIVHQLLLGKGRPGVGNLLFDVKRAASKSEDKAKALLREVLCASFSELGEGDQTASGPLVDWLLAVIMKRPPWDSWTDDVYSAMRCIDFMPIP